MTLIQTLVTRDHIVQVSDRRLTYLDGSCADVNYTKLVLWARKFSIGFTGIAFMDARQRKSTSEWIAEQVCDKATLGQAIEALRENATRAISLLHSQKEKRLSIVITGFAQSPDTGNFEPILTRVSNFEEGDAFYRSSRPRFIREDRRFTQGSDVMYTTSGAVLNSSESRIIKSRVTAPRSGMRDWNRSIRLMVVVQRMVSRRNTTVGPDALVVSIPHRVLIPKVALSHVENPDVQEDAVMFSYMPEGSMTPHRYGPVMAENGKVIDRVTSEVLGGNLDNYIISARVTERPR